AQALRVSPTGITFKLSLWTAITFLAGFNTLLVYLEVMSFSNIGAIQLRPCKRRRIAPCCLCWRPARLTQILQVYARRLLIWIRLDQAIPSSRAINCRMARGYP